MLPVLVLSYVRLGTLQKTIESILAQPHGDIYVANDGAPEKYKEEHTKVRRYLEGLLAEGIVKDVRFSAENGGTLIGISEGIDWFFNQIEIGIIIEDDLLLDSNILETIEVTSQLLMHQKVISIGLHNSVPFEQMNSLNKYFRVSNFVVSCGWVCTSENWNSRIKSFSEVDYFKLFVSMIRKIGISSAIYHLYFYLIGRKQEKSDIRHCNWDDLWQIHSFLSDKFVVVYNYNMITNIGFGFGATHTIDQVANFPVSVVKSEEIANSKQLYETLVLDRKADRYFLRNRKVTKLLRAKARLRSRIKSKFSSPME